MKSVLSPYNIIDTNQFLDGGKQYTVRVKDMPIGDKPREKMTKLGPTALSLPELIAVVLNVGTTKEEVMTLAHRIIKEYGEKTLVSETDVVKISKDLSIPESKACQLIAVGEIGRRLFHKNENGFVTIRTARDVYDYLRDMHNLPKEHLRGLYLNTQHKIIHDEVISIGTINTSVIHAREVFRPAIEYNAAAIVLAHNHPSGDASPSPEDIAITTDLVKAGSLIGIPVLDHVIITRDGFASVEVR